MATEVDEFVRSVEQVVGTPIGMVDGDISLTDGL